MSTALYRRYRPETFAEVIGQEHVTEPLMVALEKNRVNHAYLFSHPSLAIEEELGDAAVYAGKSAFPRFKA